MYRPSFISVVDYKLKFSAHVNKLVTKAHQRANMIIRCFVSRDTSLLVRAFNVYVRPVLEYCSTVWNPSLLKDITAIENVQRRFTRRLPGMSGLTYHQRLTKLALESLEIRRIRADLIFAYRVIFDLVDVNKQDFFTLRINNSRRGHCYRLHLPFSKSTVRYNYFSNRVLRIWNGLPNDVDFSSLIRFKNCLTDKILVMYCKLNFA